MLRIVFFLCITLSSFAQSHLTRAKILIDRNQYAKAESIIREYLDHNPNHLAARELLGDALSYQRNWDEAIIQYEKLLTNDSENANYNYKYGGAMAMKAQEGSKFAALGLISDIKQAFHKAVILDPMHVDAHWALVDLYVTLPGIVGGSYSKALKYAEQLQKISLVDGYLAKGYVFEYDDNPAKAEYYYKKAVVTGRSVTCYTKLSEFYEGHNNPDKAIGTLEKARREHQRNAMNYQIGKVSADYNIQLDKGRNA
jgi:tetratricopeptide (TPR) repeat protein